MNCFKSAIALFSSFDNLQKRKIKMHKSHIQVDPVKRSAQVGDRVNSVLTRNGCIKCLMFFKEIILQHLDAIQTEIQGSLTKLCAFKASRGHPSKVVKLPIMSPGAENVEYLNNP